jgi:sec-independent protein translocase protein TatB
LNLFGLSPGELILIFLIAMIVIGPEKLPETAASVGRWIREFRRVTAELTEQFADENPFTEIQRALSLTDEPASATTSAATSSESISDPKPTFAETVAANASATSVSQTVAPVVGGRSDYFNYPSYYSAIDDAWTHSGLSEYHTRGNQPATLTGAIDDEWVHGVPVITVLPAELVAPLEPTVSDLLPEPTEIASEPPSHMPSDNGVASVLTVADSDPLPARESWEQNGSHPPNQTEHHDNHHEESMTVGVGVGHSEEQGS